MNAISARLGSVLLAATMTALAVGCGDGDRVIDEDLTQAVESLAASVDSAAGDLMGGDYSDTELVGLIDVANDAEIEMGTLAQTKATDPQVREFARRIIADHRALKTRASGMAENLNLTAELPDEAEDLREDHQEAMRDLEKEAKGADFDKAFIAHEVRMHRRVLDEVEDALARNESSQLKPLLEQAKAGLQAHLNTAEELDRKLNATS
jgi:putative membrane protein